MNSGAGSGNFQGLAFRVLRVALAGVTCAAMAGCGVSGSIVPTAGTTAPVPGAPAGPILGFVWSSSDETLRPILGVLGSSLVGQPLVPAGAYVAGAASSASNLGVVEDEAGTLYSLSLPTPTPTRLTAGAPDHAQIVMAPLGGVAIAYAPGGSSVMLLANLAGTAKTTTLAMPAGSTVGSAIVSDAGTVLVQTQGSPTGIGTLSASGQFSRITTVGESGGMSFVPQAEDALVADGMSSTVSELHSVSGSASVQALSSAGVNGPLAVAVSKDAHYGVVANGGDKNVLWIDLKNGGTPTKMACACQPSVLNTLAGGKAFRLNDVSAGPVWMVDLSGTAPQMIFTPALH